MFAAVSRLLHCALRFITRDDESPTRRLGRLGESAAAGFLKSEGYAVLERNVRVPMGEADLVMLAPDGVTRVIVEVKTRDRVEGQPEKSAVTTPEMSVTARKRKKLRSIAQHLSRSNGWQRVRIDVVAIERIRGELHVRHHIDAV